MPQNVRPLSFPSTSILEECARDDRVHQDGLEGGALPPRAAERDAPRPHRLLVQAELRPHDVQHRDEGERPERLRLVLQILLLQD